LIKLRSGGKRSARSQRFAEQDVGGALYDPLEPPFQAATWIALNGPSYRAAGWETASDGSAIKENCPDRRGSADFETCLGQQRRFGQKMLRRPARAVGRHCETH
jgi:hypothetical protein